MAQKGGKRPGAGRPKSQATIQAQIQREQLVELLEPRVEKIFAALAAKAEKGDVQAAKELFDRAWGKPEQTVAVEDKRMLILDDNEPEGDTDTV